MCAIVALAVFTVSLSLSSCSHPSQAAYAKPLPAPLLSHPTKSRSVKPPRLPARKFAEPTKANSVKPPPLPARKFPEPTKASSVKLPPLPARKFPEPTKASSVKPPPLPARKFPEPTKASSVKPPPPPPSKSAQAWSPMPASGDPGASVLPPDTAKHYIVLDTAGNCTVVDDQPGAGVKLIGDKGGYALLESANKALKDFKAECKNIVGTAAEAKFEAAQAKAEKLGGVHMLTREDIDGLSYEQLKQLRGY